MDDNEVMVIDKSTLEVWKVGIEVQMHFNDMIIRNRTFLCSIVTAIFGVAAFIFSNDGLVIETEVIDVPVGIPILLLGIMLLLAYAFIDIKYYYPLLLGAVKFTTHLDEQYKELGLSTSISNQLSAHKANLVLIWFYVILIGAPLIVVILWITTICFSSK